MNWEMDGHKTSNNPRAKDVVAYTRAMAGQMESRGWIQEVFKSLRAPSPSGLCLNLTS